MQFSEAAMAPKRAQKGYSSLLSSSARATGGEKSLLIWPGWTSEKVAVAVATDGHTLVTVKSVNPAAVAVVTTSVTVVGIVKVVGLCVCWEMDAEIERCFEQVSGDVMILGPKKSGSKDDGDEAMR